jgi:hypothetical protein
MGDTVFEPKANKCKHFYHLLIIQKAKSPNNVIIYINLQKQFRIDNTSLLKDIFILRPHALSVS